MIYHWSKARGRERTPSSLLAAWTDSFLRHPRQGDARRADAQRAVRCSTRAPRQRAGMYVHGAHAW